MRKRLQQARRRGWASGHYKGVHEVWVDMQLVFNNCVTFNSTAADQQTRDMTEKVSWSLLATWYKAFAAQLCCNNLLHTTEWHANVAGLV